MDITFINAFGHNIPAIIRPAAQRLHCKDPRIVANYIKVYRQSINKNNLLVKVKNLKGSVLHPMLEEQKQTYEDMDSLQCRGIQHAEKKCRKFRKGQVAYSPQLQIVSQRIKAWSLLQKKIKGQRTSSRLLKRSLEKASILPEARAWSIASIEEELKTAFQDYYKVKGSDKVLRDSAMQQRVEALAAEGNTTKEKMITVIRHREKQRATARKIRFLRGKLSNGSTTMVTIQTEQGDSIDLTGKHEIGEAIMANNQAKYQQAFHTPFMISPLREEFGFNH